MQADSYPVQEESIQELMLLMYGEGDQTSALGPAGHQEHLRHVKPERCCQNGRDGYCFPAACARELQFQNLILVERNLCRRERTHAGRNSCILGADVNKAVTIAKRISEFDYGSTAGIEVRRYKTAEKATGFTHWKTRKTPTC